MQKVTKHFYTEQRWCHLDNTSMRVTADDINFVTILECIKIAATKSYASTARELPD